MIKYKHESQYITEILLKVALSTITPNPYMRNQFWFFKETSGFMYDHTRKKILRAISH
jgi:hypothetical protein